MKRNWMFAAWLLLFLLFTGCSDEKTVLGADAPPDALPEIVGEYIVNGLDPLGEEYSGVLAISRATDGAGYDLRWVVTGSLQQGTGYIEGNQLVVEWASTAEMPVQQAGTAVYTITVNRELYGTRMVNGYDGAGEETAYPND